MNRPRRSDLSCLALVAVVAAAAIAGPTMAQECAQLPPGAVAWWPADGTMEDLIGGHDGIDADLGFGLLVEFSQGVSGQAFDFWNGDAGMYVPAHPDLDFGPADDYSILLWMKSAPLIDPVGELTFVSKYRQWNLPYPYEFRMTAQPLAGSDPNAGTIYAQCHDDTTYAHARTSRAFDDDEFHHVSAVFRHSVSTIEVHADGALEAQGTYPQDLGLLANGGDLWFGIRGDRTSSSSYDGVLDDIMIFDRALSVCEIKRVYEAGSAGVCRGDGDVDGLMAYEDNCPDVANDTQSDIDADGHGDACDCSPLNPNYGVVPPEVCALTMEHTGGVTKLSWPSMASEGGAGVRYDVLRGYIDELPVGIGGSESCLEDDLDALETEDSFTPAPGTAVWYLVRADSQCGNGSWGFTGAALERFTPTCS